MPRSTIDPNAAGTFQTGGRPDIGHGPSFLIRALADADPETGPSLDHVIELADDDYRHDVIAGGGAARRAWRSAGAYEWCKLMDGNNFPNPDSTGMRCPSSRSTCDTRRTRRVP
ncbi:MAG: hypothetical protein ACLRYR_10815 [Bifidobacterium dentium]